MDHANYFRPAPVTKEVTFVFSTGESSELKVRIKEGPILQSGEMTLLISELAKALSRGVQRRQLWKQVGAHDHSGGLIAYWARRYLAENGAEVITEPMVMREAGNAERLIQHFNLVRVED